MSAERDELAKLLKAERWKRYTFTDEDGLPDYGIFEQTNEEVADAILAAGYRRPRQVTTVEELKALEDPETVLVDYKHNAYQWGIGLDGSEGWQSTRDPNPITSDHLWRFAPLTVLHVGGAK